LVPQKAASAAGSEAGVDCGTALAKQARLRPCGEALRGRIFAGGRAPAPAAGGRVGEKSGSQYKNSNSQARRQWGAVIATPGSSPGGSRGTSGAPHALLDRHAAKTRLKRRASLDALWRLAMTERPLSSETSDRALLGSYLAISQSGFARKPLKRPDSRKKEAWISLPPALNFLPNDLDFPSPGFGNPFHALWQVSRFTGNSPAPSRVHRAPRGQRGAPSPRGRRPPF